MAGTAVSWKTTNIAQNAGQIWANLAIPGAGARITLHTDGTPESVANPTAMHLGGTKAGAKVMVKADWTKYSIDEFRASIVSNIDVINMGISAELVGVTDSLLLEFLLPGVGTYSTAAGYKQVTIGSRAIVYNCAACIFPLIEDTTKYGIFNLYSCVNDAGVEWAQGRTELGFTPLSLVGYEITTRATADSIGNIWKQI